MGTPAKEEVDSVTRAVVFGGLTSAVEQMSSILTRSSYSSIIREMQDYSCAIFSPQGDLVAQSETIPVFLGFMSSALKNGLRVLGELHEGDTMILNDPFIGGSHTLDIQLYSPIFSRGELVGYAGAVANHVDFGGRVPATECPNCSEIYQEGLILPPVKLYERGSPNTYVFDVIKRNIREPQSTLGDLNAQNAALRQGEKRVRELCEKYGNRQVVSSMDYILRYSESRMRSDLSKLRDGSSSAESILDSDGLDTRRPAVVRVSLEKRDDKLSVDFTGTDAQVGGGLNVPVLGTRSVVNYAARCFVDPTIPTNEGCYRPITMNAPAGSLVNPLPPAAVSARHVTHQVIADALFQAFSKLMPERAVASSGTGFPVVNGDGVYGLTGSRHIIQDVLGVGLGASPRDDGLSGVDSYMSNCAMLSAEVCEVEYGWRVERLELIRDSGGPGRFRGGLGIRKDYKLLIPKSTVTFYANQYTHSSRSKGISGGKNGSPTSLYILRKGSKRWKKIDPMGTITLGEGDTISYRSPGGGGYGDPSERDVTLVLEDLLKGYISPLQAKSQYCVVLKKNSAGGYILDDTATETLRRSIKRRNGMLGA